MTWERNLYKGKQGEEIIHDMLEESGYKVIPYGYEKALSDLAEMLWEKRTTYCGDVERRIRSSPDFLVYSPEKPAGGGYCEVGELTLLEVKTRNLLNKKNSNFILYKKEKQDRIEDYIEYWDDAFLVAVIPKYDYFYIKKMKSLQSNQPVYNAVNDFQKFQKIFSDVTDATLKKYQRKVKRIFNLF